MKLGNTAKGGLTAVVVMLSLMLLLAFAEGAIRFRQWVKYGTFGSISQVYKTDPELGRVPIAGAQTRTIQINSLGFRGPEIDVPKPPDRLRIAFLGGSTTYCAEVSDNRMVWTHLVAETLQAAYPNVAIDYVNGGVPGYTVDKSLRNLQLRVAALDPDVIVIYHAANDLSGEARKLATEQGLYRDQAGAAEGGWLSRYSLLWNLVEKNLQILQAQHEVARAEGRLELDPAGIGEEFRDDLTILVREAQQVAEVVAVATFSHQIRADQTPDRQLQAAASALYYLPFMTPETLMQAYARYNDVIREVARDTGAVLVAAEMAVPGDDEHFNDTVHFKDAGSRRMAERVVRTLMEATRFQDLVEAKRESIKG